MGFFAKIIEVLRKPFPEEENRSSYIKNTLVISVFVALFLYVFQPFGMDTIESGKFLICLGFGSMTFIASYIYDVVARRVLKFRGEREYFTFGNWILNMMGIIFTISLANFLFARSLIGTMEWEFFPQMIYSTFTIGIFPVVALGWILLIRQEHKYQSIAANINQHKTNSPAIDHDLDDRAVFNIPVSRIKYVEAWQNYVKIGYVNAENKVQEQTERATLKNILSEAEESPLVRCHRSFLVNREAITMVSGNAQGLVLSLENCEKTVPVSRSYVPVFRDN
jgi:hypothetical protein